MSDELRPMSTPRKSDDSRTDSLTMLVPGVRVGKYEIVEVLGVGAFGITYRARDAVLGREVAVKEYLPVQFAARQGDLTVLPRTTKLAEVFVWGRERFLAEARTLAQLTDAPGVVDVYEFIEANGTAYMVMALVRGETLEARLESQGHLDQSGITRLLPPLLDGLERVHRAGFLHRDIKPANILVDASGQPTLIDFGSSRAALLDRTQAMTAVYTPGYAAFEQVTSSRQGPWTDIYALAGTLYHCVCGAPPPNVLERLAEDRLVPAVRLGAGRYDPRLLAMIDAGLAVRPENRPQSIDQWRGLLVDGVIAPAGSWQGPAASLKPYATRLRARRRWWIWPAAAAMLLGVAVAGYVVIEEQIRTADRQAAEQRGRAEAKRQADEAKAKAAAEARRQAEAAREKAEAEAKARAEADARHKAEADARADAAAREMAEKEAKAKAEAEAQRRSAEEEERRTEERRNAEAEAKAEAEARRQAEEERRAEENRSTESEAKRQAEASEVALRLSPPDRERVQVALTALGHDTNGVDGVFGPRTRQMIAAWQRSRGLPNTGYLTTEQLTLLFKQAAPALARHDEEADRRKLEAATQGSGPAGRDCPNCPEMIRLRAGVFMMGSTPDEPDHERDEEPRHQVVIGYAFSLGKYEVTQGEFAAFVQATGYQAAGDWRNPGFAQTDRDPVVNVSWDDARAYAAWLSRTTGKTYRLPSEAEWEYAARGGTTTTWYWGEAREKGCRFANGDEAAFGCVDSFKHTAPVGQFQPNAFGLYDMLGNVWEWTGDCWVPTYDGAPSHGEVRMSGACARRSVRGGSWGSSSGDVRSAGRTRGPSGVRNFVGFRVARAD